MSMGDKWKQFKSGDQAQQAGSAYKKVETGLWRLLDPIGKGANKLVGRMGAEGFWPTELADGEIEKAARILRTFTMDGAKADDDPSAELSGGVLGGPPQSQSEVGKSKDKYQDRKTQKVIKKIPAKVLQDACGVAIFTCFRTGFGLSGASGSGVVVAKLPDGSWGPPSGILIHTLGWGFLIGLDIYDVVLILRKPQALKSFEHPRCNLGTEISVSAGPVGQGAIVDSAINAAVPCFSYTKSKGAYAGLQLDGTIILKRDDANARFYGSKVTVSDIFSGKVKAPAAALPLLQTLYAAEGRPGVLGTQHIPQGLTPGDTEITEEEAKEMEAHNHSLDVKQPQAENVPVSQQTQEAGSTPPSAASTSHRVPPPLPPACDTATSSYPPEKT